MGLLTDFINKASCNCGRATVQLCATVGFQRISAESTQNAGRAPEPLPWKAIMRNFREFIATRRVIATTFQFLHKIRQNVPGIAPQCAAMSPKSDQMFVGMILQHSWNILGRAENFAIFAPKLAPELPAGRLNKVLEIPLPPDSSQNAPKCARHGAEMCRNELEITPNASGTDPTPLLKHLGRAENSRFLLHNSHQTFRWVFSYLLLYTI